MFDLCSVFEVQTQLSLVFATVKSLEKNLEILCSLVIYASNFKHDFLSKKSAYNTRRNTVYANNKCADQPVHPHSLISTFDVHCLDRLIPLVSISKISSFYLASVAARAGLSLPWSETPEDRFSRDGAQMRRDMRKGTSVSCV